MGEASPYWERFWQSRLSRRRVLRSAALGGAGIAAAALVGCAAEEKPSAAPGTAPGAAPSAEQPRRGGTLRFWMANPGHLDIMTLTIKWPYRVAGFAYSRLGRLNPSDLTVLADLGKWEQPDPLTQVFKIPAGVKFHNKPPVNGRELTSRDVAFSLNRARSSQAVFVHRGDYRSIDKIETPDDTTVRITSKLADASLLVTLASPQSIIIAPETIEKFSDLKLADAQIGSGPFVVQEFQPAVGGKLARHPQYFKEGLPYFDGVEISVTTASAAWDLFLAGRVDYGEVAREEIATFDPKARGFNSGPLVDCGGLNLQWVLNLQRKPYDDIRVRQALSLIIDRRVTLQNTWPSYPEGLWRPSVAIGRDHNRFNLPIEETEKLRWGWDPSKKQQDIREGIQMLEAAGISRTNPLRMEIVGDDNPGAAHGLITGEFMKGYIERVTEGRVRLEPLKLLNVAQWLGLFARGEFDGSFAHLCYGFDVDHPLSKAHASDGGRNYGRWKDPTMDRLLERERSAFDFNQRKAAVAEAQRYIADQVPTVWIGFGSNVAVTRNKLRNYTPGAGWESFEGAWFAP